MTGDELTTTAPALVDHTLVGRDGQETRITAKRLSHASSRSGEHRHAGEFAPPGWKCGACRWFEVTLFRLPDDDQNRGEAPPEARYVVHTVGRSVVPGEIDFARVAWADTPYKVLELLTQWSGSGGGGRPGDERRMPKMPDASALAVEQAARYDLDLDRAYDHWVEAGVR